MDPPDQLNPVHLLDLLAPEDRLGLMVPVVPSVPPALPDQKCHFHYPPDLLGQKGQPDLALPPDLLGLALPPDLLGL